MECKICGKTFKQYQKRNRTRCNSCNTKIRRHRTKVAAITYLGGKCKICGFVSDNPAPFHFHHRNPDEKEFAIGMVANKSWKVIKKELDKCDLLCANCHLIEHSDREGEAFLEEVAKYRGNTLDM